MARGDEGTRVTVLGTLGMLEWLAGNWQRALDHAVSAHEIAEQTQYQHARGWEGRVKALIEADLGLVEEARASAERCLAFSRSVSLESFRIMSLAGLGRLELALGNLEAADGYLRDLPERLVAAGTTTQRCPCGPTQSRLSSPAESSGGRVSTSTPTSLTRRASQVPGRWPRLVAAAVCSARQKGNSTAASDAFERVLAKLDEHPYPLERGRTLLCLGMVRRQAQQKKAAREALEQALAIFEELGARLWAEKACAELRRISGRRGTSEELTETELRVAELAGARPLEQGDRRRSVHGREHGRDAPFACVQEARRAACRARGAPGRGGRGR